MSVDPGLMWISVGADSEPHAFQVVALIADGPVLVGEFEVYAETGQLLGYREVLTDTAADHAQVQEWIAGQADHLKSLTAQRSTAPTS